MTYQKKKQIFCDETRRLTGATATVSTFATVVGHPNTPKKTLLAINRLNISFAKLHTANPRISSLGAYMFSRILHGRLFEEGGLKIFLVVGHIPAEIFLLINYILDATHTSNAMFLRTSNFSSINGFPSSLKNLLQTPNLTTNIIGANSLISRGAHLWNTLPDDIKNVNSSAVFRKKIKEWNRNKCNCKIFR